MTVFELILDNSECRVGATDCFVLKATICRYKCTLVSPLLLRFTSPILWKLLRGQVAAESLEEVKLFSRVSRSIVQVVRQPFFPEVPLRSTRWESSPQHIALGIPWQTCFLLSCPRLPDRLRLQELANSSGILRRNRILRACILLSLADIRSLGYELSTYHDPFDQFPAWLCQVKESV